MKTPRFADFYNARVAWRKYHKEKFVVEQVDFSDFISVQRECPASVLRLLLKLNAVYKSIQEQSDFELWEDYITPTVEQVINVTDRASSDRIIGELMSKLDELDTGCSECGGFVSYSTHCGCDVCDNCGTHFINGNVGARCYCGWSRSGGDGKLELLEFGEIID